MWVVIKHHDSQARRQLLFEKLRQAPTTSLTDFGYTGQRLDSSTGGLMYYGARYYLPELKRFISADTIVPSAYDSQALNRYAYVVNNPVKLVDPTGHRFSSGTPSQQELGILRRVYDPVSSQTPTVSPTMSMEELGDNYDYPMRALDETDMAVAELAATLSGPLSNLNAWLDNHGYALVSEYNQNGDPTSHCQIGASWNWVENFDIPMAPAPHVGSNVTYNTFYFDIVDGGISEPFSRVERAFTYWVDIDGALDGGEYAIDSTGHSSEFTHDILSTDLWLNVGDDVQFYGYIGGVLRYKHTSTVTGFDGDGMPLLTDSGYPGLINQPINAYYNYDACFDFSMIRILHHPT